MVIILTIEKPARESAFPERFKLAALHDYMSEVLGNKSAFKILRTLLRFRGKVFTIRELARNSGLSHPEASVVVKTLQKQRIVNIEFVGRAHQVILNDKSYALNSIIAPMFEAEERTLSVLVATLRTFFEKERKITSVAIFGSVARGAERETSDIDLLIISGDREHAGKLASEASSEIFQEFGHAISQLVLSEEELHRKRNSALLKSILQSRIHVCGKDIGAIVEGKCQKSELKRASTRITC